MTSEGAEYRGKRRARRLLLDDEESSMQLYNVSAMSGLPVRTVRLADAEWLPTGEVRTARETP